MWRYGSTHFLTSVLARGKSESSPGRFVTGKWATDTQCMRNYLALRAGEDIWKKKFCPNRESKFIPWSFTLHLVIFSLNCFWLPILLYYFHCPVLITRYSVDETVEVTKNWIVKWLSVWGKRFTHPCWNTVLL